MDGYHFAVIETSFPTLCCTVVEYVLDYGFVIRKVFARQNVPQGFVDDFVSTCKTGIRCECIVAAENTKVSVQPENSDVWEVEK